jgi:23S rRNA pseudouridine2605 synthase
MQERLQKLMAQAGIASRREAESIITQGRVSVNGHTAKLGDKADPSTDDIRVDGQRLRIESERLYIMLNKPMGIVTTVRAQGQEHRRTVRDLIPIKGHLYPVGRLDADSEGLLILTNDGELAQKLTHPRYEHPKVYEVALRGSLSEDALNVWRQGIVLDDGPTKPAEVRVLSRDSDVTRLRVTMREGRKRQIRRIATTLGHPVTRLVRTQFDTLSLGALQPGEWRYLTQSEIAALQKSAASTPHRGKGGPQPKLPKATVKSARASAVPARRVTGKTTGKATGPARQRRTPAARSSRRSPTGRKPTVRKPGMARRSPARRPASRRTNQRSR